MYYKFFRTLDKSLRASLGEVNRMLKKEETQELQRLKENIENSMTIMDEIKNNNQTNAEIINHMINNNLLNDDFIINDINETYFKMEVNFGSPDPDGALIYKFLFNVLDNLFNTYHKTYKDSFKVVKTSPIYRNNTISLKVSIPQKIDQESFLIKYNNLIFIINKIKEEFNDLITFVEKLTHVKRAMYNQSNEIIEEVKNNNIDIKLENNYLVISDFRYIYKGRLGYVFLTRAESFLKKLKS